eukprot:scaffold19817_cov18-Tisochrysis_lutea.AAC.1
MPYKGDRTGCSKLLVVFRSQVTYARKVQVLVDLSIQVELGKQLLLVLLSARAAEGAKWAIVVICSNACLQVGGSGAGVCYGRSHGQSRVGAGKLEKWMHKPMACHGPSLSGSYVRIKE